MITTAGPTTLTQDNHVWSLCPGLEPSPDTRSARKQRRGGRLGERGRLRAALQHCSTNTSAVVRRRDPGPSGSNRTQDGGEHAPLIMQTMKWGLIPNWSKVEDNTLNTINARAENLAEGGGMWGSIKGKKRCAVVCQGYYEWLTKGKDKLPHFLKRKDGNLLLMAGLYDCATIDGRTIWTFSIVTTDANSEFSWLHDRQPVFLTNKTALDAWLDTSSQSWTKELSQFVLKPYHDESVPLECYQVPKEVGKIGNESPTFIEPVANRKDGIQAMFAKQKQAKPSGSPSKSSLPTSSPAQSQSQGSKGAEADSNAPDLKIPSTPPPKVKRPRSTSPIDLSKGELESKKLKTESSKSAAGSGSTSKPKKEVSKSPRKPKAKATSSPKLAQWTPCFPLTPLNPSQTTPNQKSTAKASADGSAKITSFFKKT
ncbi:hypothetical protein NMY22_g13558 [Coprinellus aureogranulatus]|nr:hypothetical protein NMY22_g13558 [Coprinellus aureogranulatus]